MQVHLLLLCAPNPKKASSFLLLHVAPAGEPQLFFLLRRISFVREEVSLSETSFTPSRISGIFIIALFWATTPAYELPPSGLYRNATQRGQTVSHLNALQVCRYGYWRRRLH